MRRRLPRIAWLDRGSSICRSAKHGFVRSAGLRWLLVLLVSWSIDQDARAQPVVRVGSKNFTEQEIVAEIVAQLMERYTDLEVDRRFGLGGTGVCHSAILAGELDVYVEYTGTAMLDVLHHDPLTGPVDVFQVVSRLYRERFDLVWLPPIGFNDTYTLTVRSEAAEAEGWSSISDLVPAAPRMKAGFTSEFIERQDGYAGLRERYGLRFGEVVEVDPGLMYDALAEQQVDVICGFATDGRIDAYDFFVLEDDLEFFPPYDAAPVVRGSLLAKEPQILTALAPLAGTLSDDDMRRLNYSVDVSGRRPAEVARSWIASRIAGDEHYRGYGEPTGAGEGKPRDGFLAFSWKRKSEVWRKLVEHMGLTGLAMLIAVVVGLPIGIGMHRFRASSAWILAATEVVQTIPSLAMLAFLFAVYGILGTTPAVTALVLYALLPIVLNTFTGLKEVPPELLEAADGLGMSSRQRLGMVELPLAVPFIIAGVRTSTVWTVGIATLSTYIGAGGLGDFISRGLARNDSRLTLLGALPAAVLAIVLSRAIHFLEHYFEPRTSSK